MNILANFYAGPGALPHTVKEKIKKGVDDYCGQGIGVMEYSHRSPAIVDLIQDTLDRFRKLLKLDEEWELMLLQGGGSLQFVMVPWNLAKPGELVDYIDTGYWTQRAIKEASRCQRNLAVVASGEKDGFLKLPRAIQTRQNSRFLHICSNNTVAGTQWSTLPSSEAPLVVDASSDLLSKQMNYNNVNCIYAHAQKNIGIAGVTLVAVRKPALINSGAESDLPYVLDYQTHIDHQSNYHTPPVFSIYVTNLMLKWLEYDMGGLVEMERVNTEKAALLYETLDQSALFSAPVNIADRSLMNVAFRTECAQFDKEFVSFCEMKGVIGINGHRSLGGMRASLYNAITVDDVKILVSLIKQFEKSKSLAVA